MSPALARVMRGDSGFTSYDPAFAAVVGAAPQLRHFVDVDAHEGPVYRAGEDALYFTSVPARGRAVWAAVLETTGTCDCGSAPRPCPSKIDCDVSPLPTPVATGQTSQMI